MHMCAATQPLIMLYIQPIFAITFFLHISGADPMALNCHGKSAIDVAASQELKDRLLYEYRGHCLLEACRQADLSKAKKLLSSSSNSSSAVAELLAFKHPYTGKTFFIIIASSDDPELDLSNVVHYVG